LEEWCSQCTFGQRLTNRYAYLSAKAQSEALEKAIIEIGLARESVESSEKTGT